MSRTVGPDTIRTLLDASHAILLKEGPGRLTLDGVVGRTHLSKGALLHHFSSKKKLTQRLMQDAIDDFDRALGLRRGADRGAGSYTRAYVRATLLGSSRGSVGRNLRIIAALAGDSTLRPLLKRAVSRWVRNMLADRIDVTVVHIIRAAADGIWFAEIAGIRSMNPRARAQLVERMLALIDQNIL